MFARSSVPSSMRRVAVVAALVGCAAACSSSGDDGPASEDPASTVLGTTGGLASPEALELAVRRLDDIEEAVAGWRSAGTVADADAAAERARNLVTGAGTIGAGDLDGDGVEGGLEDPGLLPSESGAPGLATPLSGCADVERDVLGGSWDAPAERWAIVQSAIDEWTPVNNTFPSLPSHPQRIVGWATLALESSSIDELHEYAGHAQLHVDVTRAALDSCAAGLRAAPG